MTEIQKSTKTACLDPVWSRQPWENDKEFESFALYRDRGGQRRLDGHFTGSTISERLSWFRDHAWAERTAAYDRYLDLARVEEREKRLRETEQTRAVDRLEVYSRARQVIKNELSKIESTSFESSMPSVSVSELTRLLDVVAKWERLEEGKETDRTAIVEDDYTGWAVEDLRKLDELRRKYRAG